MIKGVIVRDQELDDSFKTDVIAYGGIELNEDKESIMKMHPKYTVFEKVDPIDCEAEIEKAMTKIRWARIEEGRKERRRRENREGSDGKTKRR